MENSEIIQKIGGRTVKISYREYWDYSAADEALVKSGYKLIKEVDWIISYYRRRNNSYAIIIIDDDFYDVNDKVGVIKYTRE